MRAGVHRRAHRPAHDQGRHRSHRFGSRHALDGRGRRSHCARFPTSSASRGSGNILKLADLTSDAGSDWPEDWEVRVTGRRPQPRDAPSKSASASGYHSGPRGRVPARQLPRLDQGCSTRCSSARHLRTVSLLPLSHLLEQIGTLFGGLLGAEVVSLRSRNPRVIFETMRDQRVNTLVLIPQLLEVFWWADARSQEATPGAAGEVTTPRPPPALPGQARAVRPLHRQGRWGPGSWDPSTTVVYLPPSSRSPGRTSAWS